MPRASKYTPSVEKRILTALQYGATRKLACQAGGISVATFAVWLHDKPGFQEAVIRAEAATAEKALKSVLKAAAEGDWRAGAWLLERRFREDYAATLAVDGQVGLTLRIEWTRDWRQLGGQVEQTTTTIPDDSLPVLDLPGA